MKLTIDQYDRLKGISDKANIVELKELIDELEGSLGSIQVECPEHGLNCRVKDNNHLILITGSAQGYGAEINWCTVSTINEWTKLVMKALKTNSTYEYSNEWFGGRTSDTCFTAIDLIMISDVCFCPDRITSFIDLNINVGESITNILKMVRKRDKYNVTIDEYFDEKQSSGIYNKGRFTKSFIKFLTLHGLNASKLKIKDLKYLYQRYVVGQGLDGPKN